MATTRRTVEVALATSGIDEHGRPIRRPIVTDPGGAAVAVEEPPMLEPDLGGDHMLINLGPQHPATHGVLRLVLELDGETVVRCIPHVGYLHCGFETTPRCTVLRVIAAELSRIISHLVWLGTTCIDIGAFTPFLCSFKEREKVYELLESWVG